MITIDTFRSMALSFPNAEEKLHFNVPSFRNKGKIFATYWVKEDWAMLKLSLINQSIFCAFDSAIFFPVPGAWGKQGATLVVLKKVRKDMFKDALTLAYNDTAQNRARKINA